MKSSLFTFYSLYIKIKVKYYKCLSKISRLTKEYELR